MNITLDRWLLLARVGHAASEDQGRPALVSLHMWSKDGRVWAEATDSMVAAQAWVEVEDAGLWDVLIPARQALLIEKDVRSLERYRSKKDTPDASILLSVGFSVDDQVGWMEVTLSEDGTLFQAEKVSRRLTVSDPETYMKLGELLDGASSRERGAITGFRVNPDLVAKLAKSTLGSLRLFFGETATSPILVTCPEAEEWRGLLAPVRENGAAE